jgi:hypothetical protein
MREPIPDLDPPVSDGDAMENKYSAVGRGWTGDALLAE